MTDFAPSGIRSAQRTKIKRTFNSGLHQKDLCLGLQGARELGVVLPQTASAARLLQVCAAQGLGEFDRSALVQAPEIVAEHPAAKG